MHRGRYDPIGSNASQVAERAPINVLIAGGTTGLSISGEVAEPAAVPATEIQELIWTDEARGRLEKVPSFARPMALLSIERYARESGIGTITPGVMDQARKKFGL
jgi:hypothetical protein